ncbi:GNAT family N-acetyltransferase [Halobacillus locisalis]|uniref:GNAT family N-acetyltransferase n=1 Tax=Halobacillus locisalis TaxID=220753 RepID=A0A838CR44_9BACI|nr:GNAT family N-acetyltransferase [Halobacillus locisalis]MBA2174602.1 GNAT family N-acetyltransferase [Halobacillus locisalis]
MKIRQATKEDASGIAMVTVQSWQSTYKGIVDDKVLREMTVEGKTERWKTKIGDGSILFVAEEKGHIIGYVHAGKERTGKSGYDGELYAIYLLEQYQGRNIGQSLIRRVAIELRKRQFTSMIVWVMDGNDAVHFYLKLGAKHTRNDQLKLGDTTHLLSGLGWTKLESLTQKNTLG